ncbi:energy transducer TonB [Thalassovita sp.]|jgi:protein TonB|uniref:energy transducer TonB n=1 Tax=Thalassovita sp. TaxID=1979401 RepID=UPI003B5A3DD1
MTLAYPQAKGCALFWSLAAAGSLALHLGLPLGLIDAVAPPPEPPTADTAGVTGAIMFDLSDLIAAPSDAGEDSAAQIASQQAPTVTQATEAVEPAKAADQPLLNQMPHEVLDDELKFGVASPEPANETEKTAQETATEYTPEQVDKNSQLGATDSVAAQASVSGQEAPRVAEKAQAQSEGLTAQDKARIEDWQRSVVLTIAKAKSYPPEARKKRIEGTVRVLFTLDSYGNLLTARVQDSSGAPVLDNSALKVLRKIGKFPTPPTVLQQDSFTLLVPLSYGIR